MKKNLLVFGCLAFGTSAMSQCTITNNSFENWQFKQYNTINGPITTNTPDNWTPLVSQLMMAFTGTQPGFMQQPTDAQDGTTSLQIYADASGTYLDGGDLMNISACNTDPAVLYAYHKFENWTLGDTATIMAFAIDYSSGTGDTIGTGIKYLAADVWNWTALSIPISYISSGADSLSIYVSFFPNNPTQPKRFKIDNFTFLPPSAIETNEITGVNVYPNPFTEFVTISGVQRGDKITVLDVSGRLIESHFAMEDKLTVLQSGTERGMYIIEVMRNQQRMVTRVCKN